MQGSDNSTLTANKESAIDFSDQQKKLKVCIIMVWIIIYLLNLFWKLRIWGKGFRNKCCSIIFGWISKDVSADNMKKTELSGYAYDFSVDYDSTSFGDILEIHKYLMVKDFLKKCLLEY